MIELKDVSKRYKSSRLEYLALQGISFSIEDGESVAIMGKSGAGKTTLLNILGCLDSFESGDYLLNGQSVKGLRDAQLAKIRNASIGFVFQDFALIESKSVIFNVMLPMYFDKTPAKSMKENAMNALNMVGLSEQASKKVNQLSGGQKQRVAIARAVVKHPSIVLADEPTGALDSNTGADIMKMLMSMNREGITVIIVTHDQDVATYCNRQIVLSDGKIISDKKVNG